jgi:hypothetical protein
VVQSQSERRPIFVETFDPRLPSIPSILNKHWRAMVAQDQYMSEVFPKPPITAFKRQSIIRNILIRAKVQSKSSENKRHFKIMIFFVKCAAHVLLLRREKNKGYNFTWNISKARNCESKNVVYAIECDKSNCKQNIYIGETERTL